MKGIENAQFDLMAYVQEKYKKAVWGAVESILRNHIDNPIVGELTAEKVKAAGIRSFYISEDPPHLEFEKCDEKEVSCKLTSNIMGVVQGHWVIYSNGARRPLTDKEEAYLTAQEQLVGFSELGPISQKTINEPEHEATASESLDTIYLYPDDRYQRGLSICWSEIPCCSGSIEFTRTDYFVEKAVGFILRERWKYDDSKAGNEAFAKAFREYMSNTSDKT